MNVDELLDHEVAAALDATGFGSVVYPDDPAGVPEFRANRVVVPPPLDPASKISIRDVAVQGPPGDPDVIVRIYSPPASATPRPCCYWIHGGGYIFGTIDMSDARCVQTAETLDCVVVSVDYRLAPESPFPAPVEDCYAGLAWTAAHADELGIDRERVVVVGQSAGGGLAAALALLVRDRAEIPLCYQLLIYPMIDDRNTTTSSQLVTKVWTREANLLGWRCYLGQEPGVGDVSPYAAPARAEDLRGLAPTFIGVGTLDVFRDENIVYAQRLLAAGVPTELHVYPGAPHGFEGLAPQAAVSQQFLRDIADALRRAMYPRW
ncbi:MAG: alpha/beta hydrolase [Acidimicrobiales bacterium]